MRASSLYLAISLAFGGPLWGQEPARCPAPDSSSAVGAVHGQVLDAESGIPLGFVHLRLTASGRTPVMEGRSGSGGAFAFCDLPAGLIEITGQIGQLGGRVGPIPLAGGETLFLRLTLSAATKDADSGTLTGIVMDAATGEPVDGAAVLIPELGQTVITNLLGHFTFPSLPTGPTEMRVSRLGYADSSGQVEVEYARTTHTRIELSSEPISLDPIRVTAVRRRLVLPGLEDVGRRVHSGWGRFVLEKEIQRRMPMRLSDVLFETGVDVRNNGHALFVRRTGCGPTVYIDDVRVTHLPQSRSALSGKLSSTGNPTPAGVKPPGPGTANAAEEAADAVNNMVHPMDVIAVEVYRGPAETPGQYLDSNAQCGVILIWTRRGNMGGQGPEGFFALCSSAPDG